MTLMVSRSISVRLTTSRFRRLRPLLQRVRDARQDAAREVREARAEFARHFEPRDRRVDREVREVVRELVHRQRELLAGLGPGMHEIAERTAQLGLNLAF